MMRLGASVAICASFAALVFLVLGVFHVRSESKDVSPQFLLDPQSYRHYFEQFNSDEKEMLGQSDPLRWEWFKQNIPWLDVPDKSMEEIYYFRWYSFQKHIKQTPKGFVIDEFEENVPWAGKYNTISAAAGHHIREARWLRNSEYVEDYANFWFGADGEPRRYSFWAADSVYSLFLATGNRSFAINLLPRLQENYRGWETTQQDANGLYWQLDDRDGMEFSIGGSGYRPTINSYMYGDAAAIARIAEMAGQTDVAKEYETKAEQLRHLVETDLWNQNDNFYETVPRKARAGWADVRELVGYIPWYFDIPAANHVIAWKQLLDSKGFAGVFGPTTAERRSPRFNFKNPHECLWNGPSWPYATTQTLVALANLLDSGEEQSVISSSDYFQLLGAYTRSQHIRAPNGRTVPWIDEDLDADTGEWLARDILISKHQRPPNRGRYYNHSGYTDLIITGLVGIRPSASNDLVIHPLVPAEKWDYFALEGLPYHGHLLTVFYDRTGERYQRGAGLTILSDGRLVGHRDSLATISVVLPDKGKSEQARAVRH
jgi:Trehalase